MKTITITNDKMDKKCYNIIEEIKETTSTRQEMKTI